MYSVFFVYGNFHMPRVALKYIVFFKSWFMAFDKILNYYFLQIIWVWVMLKHYHIKMAL